MDSHGAGQILIFARFPVPGQAKTRLIPSLGPRGAALLHQRMSEHAVRVARASRERLAENLSGGSIETPEGNRWAGNGAFAGVGGAVPVAPCAGHADGSCATPERGFQMAAQAIEANEIGITVCCTGARLKDFRAWLGTDLRYVVQPFGELGVRLHRAFHDAFRRGARWAAAVGTDIPDISSRIIQVACEKLRTNDVVIGPARDGGYYLIGLRRPCPELFAGIAWGTETVYAQTRRIIARLGLRVAELPALADVDRPEDLASLRQDARFGDVFTGIPLISIVIPALNEAEALGPVLNRLQGADAIEVIVVDAGSRDATRQIAAQAGAVVLQTPGGRAAQQNAGAQLAKGRLLLFLHADTMLPQDYAPLIRKTLENPGIAAGAFRFRTDGAARRMRLVEWSTNLRSRWLQWPYGDQGLFMEKRVFQEIGGFAALPIMEDFDLVRRLRRRGRIATLDAAAITSARRWEKLGVLRTTWINQLMVAGFLCGVPVDWLKQLYRSTGSRSR